MARPGHLLRQGSVYLSRHRLFSTAITKDKFSQKLWVLSHADTALSQILSGDVGNQTSYAPSGSLSKEVRHRFAMSLIIERLIQRKILLSPTTPFSAFGMEPFSALVGVTQTLADLKTQPLIGKYYRSPLFHDRYQDNGWDLTQIADLVADITYGIQPAAGLGYRTSPTNVALTPFMGIETGKYNLGGDAVRVAADIWAESRLSQEVIQAVAFQLEASRSAAEILKAALDVTQKWANEAAVSSTKNMAIAIRAAISDLVRTNIPAAKIQAEIERICANSRTYRILTGGDSLYETDLYGLAKRFLHHQVAGDFPLMELISANGYKITSPVTVKELERQITSEYPKHSVTVLPTDDVTALLGIYSEKAKLASQQNIICVLPLLRMTQHANEPHHVYREFDELKHALSHDATLQFLRQLIVLGESPKELKALHDDFSNLLDVATANSETKRKERKHLLSLADIERVSNLGPTALPRSAGVIHTVSTNGETGPKVTGAQTENTVLLQHLQNGGHLVAQEHIGMRAADSEGRGVYFTAAGTKPHEHQVHYPLYTSEFELALENFALARAGFLSLGLFPHESFNKIGQLVLRLHSTDSFECGGMRTPMGSINVMPNGAGKTLYIHGSAQVPVDEPNQVVIHVNYPSQIAATYNLARDFAVKGTVVTIITNPEIFGEKFTKEEEITGLSPDDIIRFPAAKPDPDLVIVTMATGVRAARTLLLNAAKSPTNPFAKLAVEIIELPCSGYPNALPQHLATRKSSTPIFVYDPYFDYGGMGSRLAKMLNDERLAHLRIKSGAFPKVHDANNQVKDAEPEYLGQLIQEQFFIHSVPQVNQVSREVQPEPASSVSSDIIAVKAVELNPGANATIQQMMVASGDAVKPQQTLAIVETDKATLEIKAITSGYVNRMISEGDKIDCDTLLFYISDKPMLEAPKTPVITASKPRQQAPKDTGDTTQIKPLTLNQIKMSENMQRSATIPQATVQYLVPITTTMSMMNRLNQPNVDQRVKLLPFILKAMAMALSDSDMNFQVGPDLKTQKLLGKTVNLGVAVATHNGGLIVVRLSNVQDKSIATLNNELNSLIERARNGKSKPEDLDMTAVSTVISNMGSSTVNVVAATGQIYGEAPNMLIIGSLQETKPRPRPGRKPEPVVDLPVAWTFDHRYRGGANTRKPMADFAQHMSNIASMSADTVLNQHSFWENRQADNEILQQQSTVSFKV